MSPVGKDDLGFKIKIISKLLTQNMDNSITSLDLTSSQARVLGYLCYQTQRQEKTYPRDIERHFRFTHPTVSGLLQRLEAKGYLIRKPNPDDGRSQMLYATQKAEKLKNSKAYIEGVFYEWLLAELPEEEKEAFCKTLDTLYWRSKRQSRAGFPDVSALIDKGGEGREE